MARNAGEPLFRRSHRTRTRVSLRFGLPSRDTGVPTCGNGEKFVDLHSLEFSERGASPPRGFDSPEMMVYIVKIRVIRSKHGP